MLRAFDTRHPGVDECAELHRVQMPPPTLADIIAWHLALAAQAYGAVDADMNCDRQFWFDLAPVWCTHRR